MILSLSELVGACDWLARREGWQRFSRDVRLIDSITLRHEEAAALAQRPEDEPAALFFALCLDLDVLGEECFSLALMVARNSALALGLELRASRFELIDLSRQVSTRVATYDDVRRWFAERLAPRM